MSCGKSHTDDGKRLERPFEGAESIVPEAIERVVRVVGLEWFLSQQKNQDIPSLVDPRQGAWYIKKS